MSLKNFIMDYIKFKISYQLNWLIRQLLHRAVRYLVVSYFYSDHDHISYINVAIVSKFFDWSEFLSHHQLCEIELFELKIKRITNTFRVKIIFKIPFTAGLRLIMVIFTILACTERTSKHYFTTLRASQHQAYSA